MSLPDEELLSAYLDGELPADERARIEQLLAESPESRQLLDELRSIQTSLQRMPRARLGHDFPEQVLRQAERELLTTGSDGEAAESGGERPRVVSPSQQVEGAGQPGRISWQRLRRPVIWASLTLAAGLLFMFLDRDRGARLGRQVAMEPGAVQEMREHDRQAGEASPADNRDGIEIGAPALPELRDSLERSFAAPKEPESQTERYGRPSSMPAAAPPPSAMAGGRGGAVGAGKPVQADSGETTNRALSEPEKKDGDATRLSDDAPKSLATDDNTLIVWCDVAPGTNYSESFRALLAEQNIRWEGEVELAEQEALLALERKANAEQEKSAALAARISRLASKPRQKRVADAEQAVLDSNNEVVLVQAGQPQIEAVLAAIDGASSVFVNVDVEPAPDAPQTQRQLQRFARGEVSAAKRVELLQESAGETTKQKEAPPARAAKQAADQADQTGAAAGFARRLGARPVPSANEAAQDEARKEPPSRLELPRSKRERDARTEDASESFALGLADLDQKTASKGQFHVLFVLHPVDSAEPPAAARASDAKPSKGND